MLPMLPSKRPFCNPQPRSSWISGLPGAVPAKWLAPILEKIAKEYDGKVIVAKVNTDENNEWAGKYDVRGIPTMLFIANGKVLHQQVGALPEPMLRNVLTQFLEVAGSN